VRHVSSQIELLTWVRLHCSVPGVGTVVAGTLKHGIIVPGATLMLGPDIGDGTFKLTAIKSIHYKRLPVAQVSAALAQECTGQC
jgi:GTPase